MRELEDHFLPFYANTVGFDAHINTPQGPQRLLYADWAASGRLYLPIEHKLQQEFGPLVANTHTESNACGEFMTASYHEARYIIKEHVGACEDDALLAAGSGMTSAVVLLQRLLGWHVPERFRDQISIAEKERPIVFVSEMEHHSNQTTWDETIANVVVVPSTSTEPIDIAQFAKLLDDYSDRPKVAAVTAASNVTGVRLPVHDIAKLMHEKGGLCFVDYTCAAPYDPINMRPDNPAEKLDAIYFSPHKFLGGPGAPGILVFDKELYQNKVPDRPGGGTVNWTNPWGGKSYIDDIEAREDGGTPPFLGLIKAALASRLKEKMGLDEIKAREEAFVVEVFDQLSDTPGISLLDGNRTDRLALFAFTINGLHHNLVTRMLNDFFGIQVRGGCACAGTYGHCLFGITPETSKEIADQIDSGDLKNKPGFTRMSLHPTMPINDVQFVVNAIKTTAANGQRWKQRYTYDETSNEFYYKGQLPQHARLQNAFIL